jgi:hypothetical protein
VAILNALMNVLVPKKISRNFCVTEKMLLCEGLRSMDLADFVDYDSMQSGFNVSEEHASSIFKVHVNKVEKACFNIYER